MKLNLKEIYCYFIVFVFFKFEMKLKTIKNIKLFTKMHLTFSDLDNSNTQTVRLRYWY